MRGPPAGYRELLLAPGQINENLFLLLDRQLEVHVTQTDSPVSFEIRPEECVGEISRFDHGPVTAR
jgi:hypothetical protein